jgi:hypothetical protein
MTWNPTEASILGGTATISTFENGKVRKHLLARVLGLTAVRVGMYLVIGLFFLLPAWQFMPYWNKIPALRFLIGAFLCISILYISLAVFFAVYAKIATRLEAIEMTNSYIKIQSHEAVKMAAWSEIKEVKVSFTSWYSVYYLGGIPGEKTPVVWIKTASWTHIIEWWRYPVEERKQAFDYILRRVVPYNVPIADDFNWIPAEYASYPHITKGATSEYETLKKVGLYMMGIGTLLSILLFAVGQGMAGAFAFAVAFIGFFCWVAGAAGVDEQKKKKEKAKLQQP